MGEGAPTIEEGVVAEDLREPGAPGILEAEAPALEGELGSGIDEAGILGGLTAGISPTPSSRRAYLAKALASFEFMLVLTLGRNIEHTVYEIFHLIDQTSC
jgi:hypothetical protein